MPLTNKPNTNCLCDVTILFVGYGLHVALLKNLNYICDIQLPFMVFCFVFSHSKHHQTCASSTI